MLTIVIIGGKWFGSEVLKQLIIDSNISIIGVCPPVQEDKLAIEAVKLDVPIYTLESVPKADLAIAAHCHQFIPKSTRDKFRLGVLAYHPSLLPIHRGKDAIRWAIQMRERITGGTLYWMDDGADTGLIEAQKHCHIIPGESPSTLWKRSLAPIGIELILETIKRLSAGEKPRGEMQDERLATFEPAFTKKKLKLE